MPSAPLIQKDIAQYICSYIVSSFLDGRDETLSYDDDLLEVLNSLQLLRMVMELESRYQITIDNSELSAENLGSIEKIAAFVAGKLA